MSDLNTDPKRALRPQDVTCFTPLGEPQVSPGGEMVAFIRQYSDLEENSTRTEIWIVGRDACPRRLTASGKRDSAPRWSPDGTRLAFISDRTGKKQLHIIDPRGGEAELVATEEEPASAPVWAPDSSQIAFAAADEMVPEEPFYAGAPDPSCLPHDSEDDEVEPLVAKTLHHKQDGMGFFGNKFRHIFVVDAEPTAHGETASTRQITEGRYSHDVPDWSPDGRYLVCTANRDLPDSDPVWIRHLWVFDVCTGEGVRVLDDEYPVYGPRWSPDGCTIAFIGADHPFNWVSSPYNLFTVDFDPDDLPRPWSAVCNLTGTLDRWVGNSAGSDLRYRGGTDHASVLWASDGSALYTTVADAGASHVYRVSADGNGAPEQVTSGERRVIGSVSLSRDGKLAYMAGGPTQPDEVFLLGPDGCEVQLTDINRPVAREFDLVEPRRILFEGADGWEIEGWLMEPSGREGDAPCPTILSVHGGPSGMYGYGFSVQFQQLVGEGFAVMYLNPRGSSGYGADFSLAVVGDWGGKDYEDLMAGLDHGVQLGIVDPDRLGVTGWSYGGFMTCWVVTQTHRFRAAVAGACVSDQYSMYGSSDVGFGFTDFSIGARPWEDPEGLMKHSSVRYMGEVTTPMLLLHGENDLRCPVGQSEEVFTALQRQGKECIMVRYPGEPHGLAKPRNQVDRLMRTAAWFHHHLS